MHTGRRWCPACGRSGSCIKLATRTDLYERQCFPPCLNLVLDGVFKFTWSPSWRLENVLTGSPQNTWKVERERDGGRWNTIVIATKEDWRFRASASAAQCAKGASVLVPVYFMNLWGPVERGERIWSMALARINSCTRRKTGYRIMYWTIVWMYKCIMFSFSNIFTFLSFRLICICTRLTVIELPPKHEVL